MGRTGRIILLVSMLLVLLGLMFKEMIAPGVVEQDSGYRVVMGTFSRVVVLARSTRQAQACIEVAFAVQDRVDALMSYQREDSELNAINRRAFEEPVAVDPMTFEVLQRAAHFSKLTEGAFDVTVGPLMDLWKKAGESNEPPTQQALAEARAKVGYEKLILNEKGRTVRFAVAGMRIDLGGIGKGYAVDKAVEAMQKRGALGGMVDLGGNIRCFGRPPHGQPYWRVGLQDPNVAPNEMGTSKPLLILALTNESIATSGDYRRFVTVRGEKQSHILDTHTGTGARALVSDTVIAPDATTADALSTAVNVLGPEKGLALIERLPHVEAILIPAGPASQPLFSTGARAYLQQTP
jgi:thiamine biosynthesis lipoprotein